MNKKGASGVCRCPSCGRVYDGTSCLACGHGSSAEGSPVSEPHSNAGTNKPTAQAQNVSPFGGFSSQHSEKEEMVLHAKVQTMQRNADNFDEDAETSADGSALGRCPQCGRVITGPSCLACSWLEGEPAIALDEQPEISSQLDASVPERSNTFSDNLPRNALSDEDEENDANEEPAANDKIREPPRRTQPSQSASEEPRQIPEVSAPKPASDKRTV